MKSLTTPITKINDVRYVYASARIRALESRMMDRQKMEMMVEAKSPDECLKLLGEIGRYDEGFSHIKSPEEYHMLLKDELKRTVELIRLLSKDPHITELFLLKYDVHNIKIFLKNWILARQKEKLFGADIEEELTVPYGNVPMGVLLKLIDEESPGNLKKYLFLEDVYHTVKSAMKDLQKTLDSQMVDFVFDRFVYEYVSRNLDESKWPFLKQLAEIMVDLANIRAWFRAKRLKVPVNRFMHVLIKGGALSGSIWLEFYNQDLEVFEKKLRLTLYGHVVKEGIEGLINEKNFHKLDSACKNLRMRFLKRAKYFSYSADVLIGYLLAKEDEADKVRAIFIGKIAGMEDHEIRDQLGMTYI